VKQGVLLGVGVGVGDAQGIVVVVVVVVPVIPDGVSQTPTIVIPLTGKEQIPVD